jgi:hypothetical protein
MSQTSAEYSRRYKERHPERVKESQRKWREANHAYVLQDKRRRNRALRGQINAPTRPRPEFCETGCGRRATREDHDHATGVFRWWLCNRCNLCLSAFGDSLEAAEVVIARLRSLL